MYIKLDEQKYKNIFAHTHKDKKSETLIAHSLLTKEYLNKILEVKNLIPLIDNLINNLDYENRDLIKKLFYNAIYLHDLGKINPSFQFNKMKNNLFKETTLSSNHSKLSVDEYKIIFLNDISDIKDDDTFFKLNYIFHCFMYPIAKHHGKLRSIDTFMCNDASFEDIKKNPSEFIKNPFEFFILNKLLFSLLVSSDYYATTEYMADLSTKKLGTILRDKKDLLIKTFEEYSIVKNIRTNTNISGINILRSKMFLEAEKTLNENLDKNIFYLEAPTGSGKTLTSINLVMNILKEEDINKIFYVFPFNTLVEQTKTVFDNIFNYDVNQKDILDIEVINSLTPIKEKDDKTQEEKDREQEDEESKYQKSYMGRLFFHNELIITTHISFFNILFGTSKEDNFPLWQLANSVIILDEIQSYDNNLWSYMTKFFEVYAKALNMKIIIMSATLPKLDRLIEKDESKDVFVELIKNRDEYFYNDYFKKRVEIDYSILNKKYDNKNISFKELKKELFDRKNNYNKILFEFITKKSARTFYNNLIEDVDYKDFAIRELSGDDNKAYRQKVIDESKEDIKIIIIATQVIEAGVDIDMDLGFKDISTLDSEEQFMGRINRSCLKLNRKVYFFDLDDEKAIYKEDNRIEFNLKNTKWQEVLKSKNFVEFYDELLEKLKMNDSSILSGIEDNYEKFNNDVKKLEYKKIQDKMQLIKSETFRLYFPFTLDIKQYKIKEFENIDEIFLRDGLLDGQKVWNVFIELNNIEGYAKKEINRYKLNSLMQFFTFNIVKYPWSPRPIIGDDEFGFYYVKNFDKFITDDKKFDRAKYNDYVNDVFIM